MTTSKYGDLIRKARESENQETVHSENQQARKPDSQIQEPTSQFSSTTADQIVVKPDNQRAREPEREVNLCVKVPENLRRHWAAESKRQGVTMTEIIVQALSDRFGKPN